MSTIPAELRAARCLALTTFKRDGTPIVTPVWFHLTDDKICVTTKSSAAKLKRIANNPHVTYATCTQRGKVTGAVHHGDARILDAAGSARVLADKKRHYFAQRILSLLPPLKNQIGIEITSRA